jgi:predicted TIM-barrel fold metal-dependent hydrolase
MIIDAHTHIFSKDVAQNRDRFCAADPCFDVLYSHPKARLLCVEDLISSMDEQGITRSAILNIGWKNHQSCVRTNDYILDAIARYPSRLIGFCGAQPLEREGAIKEMERCFSSGATGIGELRPDVQGYDLCDAELMNPFVESLIRHARTLVLHASEPVGHLYPGKGSVTPGGLYSFIMEYANLKVILAHFGGGLAFYELMPEVAAGLQNTYYDTAAAPFLYQPQIYRTLVSIAGSGRLLFGSDWPLMDQKRVLDHIRSGGLDGKDLENVTGANAARLFGCSTAES